MRIAFALVLTWPAWACVAVEGDRILAGDLAAASAEFASLDASLEIGYSPRVGVTRVFQPGDLAALARKHDVMPRDRWQSVCFVRAADKPGAGHAASPMIRDVERGQKVEVEVISGAARLRFEADADSAGHTGDSVLVRNPENGKLFQARVGGKGKVVVQR